jgi:hypothetical protein
MKKFIIFLLLALSVCIFAQDKKQNKMFLMKNKKKIFTYKNDTEETSLETEEDDNEEYWENYVEDDTVENDTELYEDPIEDDTDKNMSDFSE